MNVPVRALSVFGLLPGGSAVSRHKTKLSSREKRSIGEFYLMTSERLQPGVGVQSRLKIFKNNNRKQALILFPAIGALTDPESASPTRTIPRNSASHCSTICGDIRYTALGRQTFRRRRDQNFDRDQTRGTMRSWRNLMLSNGHRMPSSLADRAECAAIVPPTATCTSTTPRTASDC